MSSQNRADPFEIRPESGLGGRWPMRWRPGTSVKGYPVLAIRLPGVPDFGDCSNTTTTTATTTATTINTTTTTA